MIDRVLLYRDLDGNGFNILSHEYTHIERGLNYVHLEDVTFNVCEGRRDVALLGKEKVVHAVAMGNLIEALFSDLNPPRDMYERFLKGRKVDYKLGPDAFFFTVDDGKEIQTAKTLIAIGDTVVVEE